MQGGRRTMLQITLLACMMAAAAAAPCRPKQGLRVGKCVPCVDPLCVDCSTNWSQCKRCAAELWDPANPISYFVNANFKCQRCDTNPSTKNCDPSAGCNSDGSCKKCAAGHGLVGKECQKCGFGCATCDGNPEQCRKCYNVEADPSLAFTTGRTANFALVGGICKQCGDGCAACPNGGACTRCMAGTGLSGGRCIGCAPGCGYGNGGACNSRGACTKCDQTFGLVAGKCKDCQDPNDLCTRCDGNPKSCTACQTDSSVALDRRTKKCMPCKARYCKQCATPGGGCQKCLEGYGLVGGQCLGCRNKGCRTCDGNVNSCKACQGDLDDNLNFFFLDPVAKICLPFPAHIA